MAIRTTDTANRMVTESVLLTMQIKARLDADPGVDGGTPVGVRTDTGVMAATLAGAIISTFGKSLLGSALFEEVDDSELPPANMTDADAGRATRA